MPRALDLLDAIDRERETTSRRPSADSLLDAIDRERADDMLDRVDAERRPARNPMAAYGGGIPGSASIPDPDPAPASDGRYTDRDWSDIGSRLLDTLGLTGQQIAAGVTENVGDVLAAKPDRRSALSFFPGLQVLKIGAGEPTQDAGRQIADLGHRVYSEAEKGLKEADPNLDPWSAKGLAFNTANVMAQLVPAIATSVALGGGGLAVMGAQVYGQQYGSARAEGMSPRAATMEAAAYSAVETLSEMIPLGILTKEGGRFLSRVLKAMGAEGIQEAVTQVVEQGYEARKLANTEGISYGEAWDKLGGWENVGYAGTLGSVAGGGLAAAVHPFVRRDEGTPEPLPRERIEPTFDNLTPEDEASPLRNEDLSAGYDAMDRAISGATADEILTRNGLPGVGQRVGVDLGDGQVSAGTILDAYAQSAGEELDVSDDGIRIQMDDGTVFEDFLGTLRTSGGSITPWQDTPSEVATDEQGGAVSATPATTAPPEAETPPVEAPVSRETPQADVTRDEWQNILDAANDFGSDRNAGVSLEQYYENVEESLGRPLNEGEREQIKRRYLDGAIGEADDVGDYDQPEEKPNDDAQKVSPERQAEADAAAKAGPTADEGKVQDGNAAKPRQGDDGVLRDRPVAATTGSVEEPGGLPAGAPAVPPSLPPSGTGDRTADDLTETLATRYKARGFNPEVAKKNAERLAKAIRTGQYDDVVHPDNKQSRELFMHATGIELPKGVTATKAVFKGQSLERQDQQATGDGTRSAPVNLDTGADLATAREKIAEPTEAQKEAGNYQKGHVKWQGLDITIETAKGQERSGVDKGGKSWSVKMPADYGYIKRTEGADGDHVDVYLGPQLDADEVYIVNQYDLATGKFDEHKVMLGFRSSGEARKAYNAGFSDGKGPQRGRGITALSVDEFRNWLKNGNTAKPSPTDGLTEAERKAKAPTKDEDDPDAELWVTRANKPHMDIGGEYVVVPVTEERYRRLIAPLSREPSTMAKWQKAVADQGDPVPTHLLLTRNDKGTKLFRVGSKEEIGRYIQGRVDRGWFKKVGAFSDADAQAFRRVGDEEADSAKAGKKAGKSDWTEIGKNHIGQTLYEDQNGARSFIENGVRVTESVPMVPTRGGVVPLPNPPESKKKEFQVVGEKMDTPINERTDADQSADIPEPNNRTPETEPQTAGEAFTEALIRRTKRQSLAVVQPLRGRSNYDPLIHMISVGDDVNLDDAGADAIAALAKQPRPEGWEKAEIQVDGDDGEQVTMPAGAVAQSLYRRIGAAESLLECLRT